VLGELKQRGVQDVLICFVDGLKDFPEAIEAVFPHAWVQTCMRPKRDTYASLMLECLSAVGVEAVAGPGGVLRALGR
jgi:hypothetical protein